MDEDKVIGRQAASKLDNPTPRTSNATVMPSDDNGPENDVRGNGMVVEKDGDDDALIAKQRELSAGDLQRGQDYITDHGDVGRAGSYRIDGVRTEY